MNSSSRLVLISLFTFMLAACVPSDTNRVVKPDNSVLMQATAAEQQGEYANAAKLYSQLADSIQGEQQADYYLRAAQMYWQLRDVSQTESILAKINVNLLSSVKQADVAILRAQLADYQNKPEAILAALDNIALSTVMQAQAVDILTLKINAFQQTQNWLEKALSHIALADYLPASEQLQNQQALWQAVTSLTPQALDLFNPGIPPAIDSGWFALAYAITAYQTNPEALGVAMTDWRRNYPNHPADPSLYESILSMGTQLPKDINSIAILLPNTGPYASAAEAIKRGILSAYYSQPSDTSLHFFDVEVNASSGLSNAAALYQQAVDMGVSLVIGPLSKESINQLLQLETLSVPVLALNRVSTQQAPQNLYQFGLAPEDDATSGAAYALSRDFQRAVILSPQNEWGNRIASSFSDAWIQAGGSVLKQAYYEESINDFSDTITALFELDASEQRYQALKQRLGQPLEFEPRRRQDIDFVFLVARTTKARQLMPQLKFHRSGSLPILATSHAYSGFSDAQKDIDLNGLQITDIPWIVIPERDDEALNVLSTSNDTQFKQLIRLYALGADAYHLIPNLNALSRSAQSEYQGATGILTIDEEGIIHRQMMPAIFSNGMIRAVTVN